MEGNQNEEKTTVEQFGAAKAETKDGTIYMLTIVGQIEGHQLLPETTKTTKYEHILPLLASIEESDEISGLLLLLNTVGGDIEAGLAIAELIAGMKKPMFRLCLAADIQSAFRLRLPQSAALSPIPPA